MVTLISFKHCLQMAYIFYCNVWSAKSVKFFNLFGFKIQSSSCSMSSRKKIKQITDLDNSDNQIQVRDNDLSVSGDIVEKKNLSKLCGNFNRSKSAEWESPKKKPNPPEVHSFERGKNKHMEGLIERIAKLYKYNNEFAKENKKLLSRLKKAEENKEKCSKSCEKCNQVKAEKKELQTTNSNLQKDVDMMKVLVYRLNVQIESYQDKLRQIQGHNADDDITQGILQERKNPEFKWGSVNTETLGPLLNSYEEMIKDKNDLIQQHEKELQHFTGEFKKIIEENLKLHEECDSIKKSSNGWMETKTRLQSQIESLKTKLDLQTKRADLAKVKLLEVIQCYEQKAQSLSLDLEHLQNAYTRCKNELANVKGSKSNHPNLVNESLKECKDLFEKLKSQHKAEKNDLESRIEILCKENKGLNNKIDDLIKQLDELKNKQYSCEDSKDKTLSVQLSTEKLIKSRERLKTRLKIALEWAKKLEQEHINYDHNWDAVKRLEIVVKHKEAQMRGLHKRHVEEMDKMQQKLQQKEETIKNLLQSKII